MDTDLMEKVSKMNFDNASASSKHVKVHAEPSSVNVLGIDIVPEDQKTKAPTELFFVWCAANIGILGVVYGAIIVSFGLSFFQRL